MKRRKSTSDLDAMRDRVAELGGTLTVESAPGEGTALAVSVPTP